MNNWLLAVVAFLVFTAFWAIYHIMVANTQKASFIKKEILGKIVQRDKELGIITVKVETDGKILFVNKGFYYKGCGKKLAQNLIKEIAKGDEKKTAVYLNAKDFRHSSLTDPSIIVPLRYYICVAICSILIILTMVYA